MNVSELFKLTLWIRCEIQEKGIPSMYQTLASILHQHANPNQQKQPFESERNTLIETIKIVPLGQLTKDQINFLQKLKISDSIGNEGVEIVEDILYKNIIDVVTSAQKLQEIAQNLAEGIAKSDQIMAGLAGCVPEEKYEQENEVLMRVSFTGDALMANVKDFKDWGIIWHDIGRGVAMAHGLSPEEIKIVGATKGSIIIELSVIAEIAGTLSAIILAGLKVAEKILDMNKKAEEIRGLKLANDKIANELEAEADNEKISGITNITNQIVINLNLNQSTEGDKIKALDKAIKNLVDFIEKGGEVDFLLPDETNEQTNTEANRNADLRVAFEQIRQLEKKLALLEHNSNV